MNIYPKNAAPRAVFHGFRDASAREPERQRFSRPTFLNLSLIRAGWGPETDQFVSGDRIKTLYGNDVFDRRSPYFTHANLLASEINAAAAPLLTVRMVPEDAPNAAGVTVWIEIVEDEVPNYDRNDDQSYKLNLAGEKVIHPTVPRNQGLRFRLFTSALGTEPGQTGKFELGLQETRAGALTSSDGNTTSTAYPLFDLQRPHRGARGDWGAFSFSPQFTTTRSGVRPDLVESIAGFVYRFAFYERPAVNKSPLIKPTLTSADYMDLTFKAGAFDETMRLDIDVRERLIQAYNEKSSDGGPDTFGVFSGMHVYEDHLKTVQDLFVDAEGATGLLSLNGGDALPDMVNFLTGINHENIPYYNCVRDGGSVFTDASRHYAVGGGDGTLTDEQYEADVVRFMDTFETNSLRLWDPFRVPVSTFYDSGYTLPTKLSLCALAGLRDDINVYMSTQTYGQPLLTEEEEYSIGRILSQELLSYPESIVHGTQACRGRVFGMGARRPALNNGNKVIPAITFHHAVQMAHFGGATSGVLDQIWVPSLPSRNVLVGMADNNSQSKSDRTIDNYWTSGIVYAQYKDRANIFVPAYQTVTEDDTSNLNNDMAVFLMTDVTKICREVWTELTGQQGLSEEQFILRSDDMIRKRTSDKYGNLLRVRPTTYFTDTDTRLGWPWQTRVECESDFLRTVGMFEVVATRPEGA